VFFPRTSRVAVVPLKAVPQQLAASSTMQSCVLLFHLTRIPTFVLQATKLQSLYAQAQSDLEDAEGKVVTLSAELETAQETAEKLRREMRNLQVRPWPDNDTGASTASVLCCASVLWLFDPWQPGLTCTGVLVWSICVMRTALHTAHVKECVCQHSHCSVVLPQPTSLASCLSMLR
jgi:hypothetical protein